MLPCASVSEALCCVNRKLLGFVSTFKGYLKAPTHRLLPAFFTCWSSVSPLCINTSTTCRDTSQKAVEMSPLIWPFFFSLGCFPAGLTTLLIFSHPSLLNMSWFWHCPDFCHNVVVSGGMCLVLAAVSYWFYQTISFRHKLHSEMSPSFFSSFAITFSGMWMFSW